MNNKTLKSQRDLLLKGNFSIHSLINKQSSYRSHNSPLYSIALKPRWQ